MAMEDGPPTGVSPQAKGLMLASPSLGGEPRAPWAAGRQRVPRRPMRV